MVEGYVKKGNDFLLASIVIFRPFDLNTLLTSFLVFSISFGVALKTARPSLRHSPTSSLNLDAIKRVSSYQFAGFCAVVRAHCDIKHVVCVLLSPWRVLVVKE